MELVWNGKQSSTSNHKGDVYVSVCVKDSKKGDVPENKHLTIRFANSSYLRITKTNRLEWARQGTRLYFRESTSPKAIKLTSFNPEGTYCHIKINLTKCQFAIGDYNLFYDKELGVYYIDEMKRVK